eukprot:COSAG01_NODE_9425_length_2455_cov_14.507234_2_plen_129_part_00
MVLELNKRIKASGQQKVGILEEIKAGGKQTAELFWEKARLELEAVDLGDPPPPRPAAQDWLSRPAERGRGRGMYPVRIFLRSPSQMTEIPIHLGYPVCRGLVAAVSVWRAPAGRGAVAGELLWRWARS